MTATRNIKLTIEYNGRAFAGWQVQPGQRTVQGEIENAASKFTGEKISLLGAGRTDAGVHARGQAANFRTSCRRPLHKFQPGLNFYLPGQVRIVAVKEVPLSFHARFDAAYRTYRYCLNCQTNALDAGRVWTITHPLNISALDWAAEFVTGLHDFSAFCRVSSQKDDNRCLVYKSHWTYAPDFYIYEITANRFLHTMIRSLVALMINLAGGQTTKTEFKKIFAARDHTRLKMVAPPDGLYLTTVGY